jgi:sulfate/thiosulfate transport system ATP-binding protein
MLTEIDPVTRQPAAQLAVEALPPSHIRIAGVSRHFGTFAALRDVSLDVAAGELVSLLGPSGSGKTTLLRIMAGLERPDRGRLFLSGVDATNFPARERRAGFVFQNYALFKHMTVFENVAFGLRVRPRGQRLAETAIRQRVEELLALVRLESLGARKPAQLSGGQQQRVALARALAIQPRVLLLDEPFGALDTLVRHDLRQQLREIQTRLGITTVLVTHDQEEALFVSDRIAVMNAGVIEQIGAPNDVLHRPATSFVASFMERSRAAHAR